MGNGNRPTPEFRRQAVRLTPTSGRTRREIAADRGIGLSTLTRWLSQERDASEPSETSVDLHAELKRLRRENAVLKHLSRISRMCRVLGVRQSGFFAWQDRPACRRQQRDMVYMAHIRTAFALSNGTCGSPRMHRDLVDEGHQIGRHRTARLVRENQLIVRRRRRFKRTTDSEHVWPVAPDLTGMPSRGFMRPPVPRPDQCAVGPVEWASRNAFLYRQIPIDMHRLATMD